MPASFDALAPTSHEDLLASLPLFSAVPAELLGRTAALLTERCFQPGEAVVTEGERGDAMFIVVEGTAEVTAATPSGSLPLDVIAPGETFGELALIRADAARQATVTALTPLRTLLLERAPFEALRLAAPDLDLFLARSAELLFVAKALKIASPFAKVEMARLKEVAARVERVAAAPGDEMVREGEEGDTCFLILRGEAEVLVGSGDGARAVGTLRDGALFGEAALLTQTRRSATVRAKTELELLRIDRALVLELLSDNLELLRGLTELLQMRVRPRWREGVEAHHRVNDGGERVTTLKDPASCRYYRLSEEGFFVWEQLDGNRTIRDIVLATLVKFKKFAPQMVCTVVSGLTAAGFVEIPRYQTDVEALLGAGAEKPTSFSLLLRRLVERRFVFSGVDPCVAFLSRLFAPLMTRLGTFALGAVAVVGAASFLPALRGMRPGQLAQPRAFLLFLALVALSVLIHEAAHACTARRFGYLVDRAGVGWFWFLPVAFVDTSESWVGSKRERMLISAAGPWSTLVLASLAALALPLASGPGAAAALAAFAAFSYLLVLANLNPLVEFDGYYLLSDWLDEPNLRLKALGELRAGRCPGGKPLTRPSRWYFAASALFISVPLLAAACLIFGG